MTQEPVVVLVVGKQGSGKTVFLRQMTEQADGRMVLLTPKWPGESGEQSFDYVPDWKDVDSVAIDQPQWYERDSLKHGLKALELDAQKHGKKIYVSIYYADFFKDQNIEFQTEPAVIDLNKTVEAIPYVYRGKSSALIRPPFDEDRHGNSAWRA